jgi:hypothetical protein
MIRKAVTLGLLVALAAAASAADWRAEVAGFLDGTRPDGHSQARQYLAGLFGSLSDDDKPVACGLLAYLSNRVGDRREEYVRLGEYFEKYGSLGLGFHFLTPAVHADVARYLREWQFRYPWVLRIGIVALGSVTVAKSIHPPEKLLLGVEMANNVLYKLTSGEDVIKGGEFRRGFNAVGLETRDLFREPGAHPYVLEFKAGDLIVRREIVLGVQVNAVGLLREPAGSGRPPDYIVKIFLGENLLASSRKSPPVTPAAQIETPPPTGVYDPFGPGYQNEPKIPSSFPIMAIPAVIKEILDQFKKKDEVEPVPPVELKTEMAFTFTKKNAMGRDIEVRAQLSLGLRSIQFLPFSLSREPAGNNRPEAPGDQR